jgi:hypothetical protein
VKFLQRRVFPLLTWLGTHTVDVSRHVLMMHHELYRHVEMELFVPAARVVEAAAFVEWVLRRCAGESAVRPAGLDLTSDEEATLNSLGGKYFHDQAVTFRKVLPDETLISMTSGATQAWYAISLETYQSELMPFQDMAGFVARTLVSKYRARPHWGKLCPLEPEQIAGLYPGLTEFRKVCESVDPQGMFQNEFTAAIVGGPAVSRLAQPA